MDSLQPCAQICIFGYKNIPVSIDDALKAVQAERNVETIISARSAQRIECVGGKVRWKISSH